MRGLWIHTFCSVPPGPGCGPFASRHQLCQKILWIFDERAEDQGSKFIVTEHWRSVRPRVCACAAGAMLAATVAHADPAWSNRWVWIFGLNPNRDSDMRDIETILRTAAQHRYNGAVWSAGLDSLCRKSPEDLRRLETIRAWCEQLGLELIPSVFSVGYGGGFLAHNRHLAEGVPVKNALFEVRGGSAWLVPDPPVSIQNPSFEDHTGHRVAGYRFHDQPGQVSFVDTNIARSGRCSLRFENFRSNPHGHGRVMQEVRVHPHRCYRVSVWVKTEGLEPRDSFRVQILDGSRSLAPREFGLEGTRDWTRLVLVFNSMTCEVVRVYAGVWGARSGRFWLDDWSIEELGPINVLRRPGTPVQVRADDPTQEVFVEDRDYATLVDPNFHLYRWDRPAPAIRVLPGGRIRDGQRLRVSWYHPILIHESQITVCMAEPELYEIAEHEAALLARHLRPRRVLLSMDEIRMGGTCAACAGRDMAALLGECVTRLSATLRRHIQDCEVLIWSDMFDPGHNAHARYYLVEGDFTGSWNYIPKSTVVVVWGGRPRESSLKFFSEHGFPIVIAGYYDSDRLDDVREWLRLGRALPAVRGFMYTTWQRRYEFLPEVGAMLVQP